MLDQLYPKAVHFQEWNCFYKVFGWRIDGKWLLDLAAQQIYLHIASKWLFYVPRWHLANSWYSLTCCHEETDTWMLLHSKHARDHGAAKFSNSYTWHWRFYLDAVLSRRNRWALHENWKRQQETCYQHRCREETNRAGDIDINKFCAALLGLHGFTECDSASAFAGKGKAKCCNLLRKNLQFLETLESLRENWNVTDQAIDKMEKFCCPLYDGGRKTNVNRLREKMCCSKRGKLECE